MSDTPTPGRGSPDRDPIDPTPPPIHAPRVHRPTLRPAMGHDMGDPPSGSDAPYLLDRYSVLAHELGNLLDGSLRTLVLAQRSLDDSGDPQTSEADRLRTRLETVHTALHRMTDLVRASAAGSEASIGSLAVGPRAPVTIGEAAHHASEVLGPLADDSRVDVTVSIQPEAAVLPAHRLYTVLLNGLRNAIDAASDAVEGVDGRGHVDVRVSRDGNELAIVIIDDGVGPGDDAGERAFVHGYTTKEGGRGIGLALSRQIVEHMGGRIELAERGDAHERARPGAVLTVVVPIETGDSGESA